MTSVNDPVNGLGAFGERVFELRKLFKRLRLVAQVSSNVNKLSRASLPVALN